MDPNMMAPHVMAPAPFFYYNPDPHAESRQHGHFSQQPTMQQMPMYPVVPTLPSTPIYSRPSSSCSQPAMQPKMLSAVPSNLTPMASPQMACQRPTIMLQNGAAKLMLETEMYENDGGYYPATPALSTSGSNVGSPGSTNDMLSTPLNPMFSGLDGYENVKPDVESMPDGLEGLDWSSCTSPPMTPGKYWMFPSICCSIQLGDRASQEVCLEINSGAAAVYLVAQVPGMSFWRGIGPFLKLASYRQFHRLGIKAS
jgi:C2H2 transcription facotor